MATRRSKRYEIPRRKRHGKNPINMPHLLASLLNESIFITRGTSMPPIFPALTEFASSERHCLID